MSINLPTISIVIPTLNSEKLLPMCLESIRKQDYPRGNLEILVIDGGSVDKTLDVAKNFSVDRLISNPLKTAEAAYAIAMREAKNEIIAHIDSDNVLPSKDWLQRMVEPFEDEEIVAAEPVYYTRRSQDNSMTRYCALLGMNDPLCRYLGNYDRFCVLTGKWTETSVKVEDRANYFKVELQSESLPTLGANGFLARRRDLIDCYHVKDYWFDIDAICALVKSGCNKFGKVKVGVVHLFAGNLKTVVKKQRRRIKDYLFFDDQDMRSYDWKNSNKVKIGVFVMSTLLLSPLLLDLLKGLRRVGDRALLLHVPVCWITLIVYGIGVFESLGKKEMASREKW